MNRRELLSVVPAMAMPVPSVKADGWAERYPVLSDEKRAELWRAFWESVGADEVGDYYVKRGANYSGVSFVISREFCRGDHDGEPIMFGRFYAGSLLEVSSALSEDHSINLINARYAGKSVGEHARAASPWIPLGECRPELGKRVLLRWDTPGAVDGSGSHVCVYTWHERWEDAMASNVPGAALPTHWMAIPEVRR